jgi:hypothetical protein
MFVFRGIEQVLLQKEDLFGDYLCQIFQDLSLEPLEVLKEVIGVERGRKAPVIQLTPQMVGMTSASFQVQEGQSQKEETGVVLPLVGYVVQYKVDCHIGDDWTSANFTAHENGKLKMAKAPWVLLF